MSGCYSTRANGLTSCARGSKGLKVYVYVINAITSSSPIVKVAQVGRGKPLSMRVLWRTSRSSWTVNKAATGRSVTGFKASGEQQRP